MKKEDLFKAIGQIDDSLLEQSEKNKSRLYWMIGAGVALTAAALLIFTVINQLPVQNPGHEVIVNPKPDEEPVINEPNYDELPKIEISFENGGMGFEGYIVKDISDLKDVNGWNESVTYETLPVYRNQLKNAGKDDVKKIALDIAGKLNMNVDETEVKMDYDEKFDIHSATIEDENYRVRTLSEDLCTTIELLNPLALPEDINNTYDATYEEKVAATQYMMNEWKDVICIDDPQLLITGGDFDTNKEQRYNSVILDGKSDIFDFFKKQATIYDYSENSMWLLRIWEEKEFELIADYPIISVDEARQMLLDGKYVTSSPDPIELVEKNILKVEMVYRGGRYSDVVLPYYRFYMQPKGYEEDPEGYFMAGVYYVPAIEECFIANEDLWKGQFN